MDLITDPEPEHHDHNCKDTCRKCYQDCMRLYTEIKKRPENQSRLTKDARIELDRFPDNIRIRVRNTYSSRRHHWRKKHPEEDLAREKISRIESQEAMNMIAHREELARLDGLKRSQEIKSKRDALKPRKSINTYTVYESRIIQDYQGRAIIGNDPIPLNVNPESRQVLEDIFGSNGKFVPNQHKGGVVQDVVRCKKCDLGFYSNHELQEHEKKCKVFKRFKRSR